MPWTIARTLHLAPRGWAVLLGNAVAVLALTVTAASAAAVTGQGTAPQTVVPGSAAGPSAASAIASLVPLPFQGTGPDVSSYQHAGPLDWTEVRKTGGFAILKATEGSGYVNPYFAADWAAAAGTHLPRGAYHFARPAWPLSSADSQARAFAATVGVMSRLGDLPPVLDLEVSGGLSPGQLVMWTQEWLRTVRGLTGRTPVLYTYPSFWLGHMAGTGALAADGIPLWIADYSGGSSPRLIGGWRTWTLWQYTSAGTQVGITGQVDLSRFHGGVAQMRSFASGRSAPVSTSPPAAPVASADTASGQLVVSWVPGADGWSRPTSWSVRIQPTGRLLRVAGGQSSVTVGGVPLGVPVTAVVTAQNALGFSGPSAPSAPVVLRAVTSVTSLTGAGPVPVGTRLTFRFRFSSPNSPVSGRQLRIQALPTLGGAGEALGSVRTGPDGVASISVRPHQGVQIVAAFDGTATQHPSRSAAVLVRVVPRVRLTAPATAIAGRIRVTGWTDAPTGTPVAVEVLTSDGWQVVARTSVAPTGFAVTVARPAGTTSWRISVLETRGSVRSQSAVGRTIVTPPVPPTSR